MNGNVETHPSFGLASVSRGQVGGDGTSLFQSDIRHREIVTLRLKQAQRRHDLHRDWVTETEPIVEVSMSLAQWYGLVTSFGGQGTPVTVTYVRDVGQIERLDHTSRAAETIAGARAAADTAFADIKEAFAAVEAAFDSKAGRKETAQLLNTLRARIGNAPGNIAFAAESVTRHIERTVQHAKADVEAFAAAAVAQHQIGAASMPVIELGTGDDQ